VRVKLAPADNAGMLIRFTKMQGAGNDFVMLDETRQRLNLSPGQYRFLADRHFGVGADQILSVRPASEAGIDFEYVIHNADGGEVEQCGNGARCFVRFVREQGLTDKDAVRVKTLSGVIEPRLQPDGRVTVDMGAPIFDLARVPFDPAGLTPQAVNSWQKWPLALAGIEKSAPVFIAVLSMGNPHAVQLVDEVETAPVLETGPLIEGHARFPRRVNAGFMQIVSRSQIRLRVYERGAGIRLGLLDARVDVWTHGGTLTIEWQGGVDALPAPVLMTGPATTVFEASIEVPDHL
jgi:diaminopimelate epimerase